MSLIFLQTEPDLSAPKKKKRLPVMASNLAIVRSSIDSFANFPKEGVNFKDVFSVFRNPAALKALIALVKEKAR